MHLCMNEIKSTHWNINVVVARLTFWTFCYTTLMFAVPRWCDVECAPCFCMIFANAEPHTAHCKLCAVLCSHGLSRKSGFSIAMKHHKQLYLIINHQITIDTHWERTHQFHDSNCGNTGPIPYGVPPRTLTRSRWNFSTKDLTSKKPKNGPPTTFGPTGDYQVIVNPTGIGRSWLQ